MDGENKHHLTERLEAAIYPSSRWSAIFSPFVVVPELLGGELTVTQPMRDFTLTTPAGHRLQFNDSVIEIETVNGHRLTLDDRTNSIRLHCAGTLSIDCEQDLNLTAQGTVNIKGTRINLN